MQPITRLMVALGVSSTLAWGNSGASSSAPLRLGVIDETFYEVVGQVVAQTLEHRGYTVEVHAGSHTEVYEAIGNGDVDLCVAFWLPDGHKKQWSALGARVSEVVTLYNGAQFFWGVPNYMPASDVSEIADLARPEVAQRMERTIHGLALDTSITTESMEAVNRYRLSTLGYSVTPGSFATWTAALQDAAAQRRWIVVPTWTPYWFVREYGLRPLKDPKNIFGGANRVVLAMHGNPKEHAYLTPADINAIHDLKMTLDDVVDMDFDVNKNHLSPAEAARHWLHKQPK